MNDQRCDGVRGKACSNCKGTDRNCEYDELLVRPTLTPANQVTEAHILPWLRPDIELSFDEIITGLRLIRNVAPRDKRWAANMLMSRFSSLQGLAAGGLAQLVNVAICQQQTALVLDNYWNDPMNVRPVGRYKATCHTCRPEHGPAHASLGGLYSQ